jgi:hypothetical protein
MFCICRHTPFGICPASMMQDVAPSFAEQIFMRGVSTSGGKKRRDYLKIDSSYIGMESARRYTSVERKSISMTVVNAVAMQGGEMGNRSFADLFQTETGEEDTEPYMDGLTKVTGLMQTGSARSITSLEEKRAMQSIRQQCLQYLIRLLYGDKWKDVQVDDTYLQPVTTGQQAAIRRVNLTASYYHEEAEDTAFRTSGTVRTADGREISFGLELGMSRRFREETKIENITEIVDLTDPLVINLDGNIAGLSDQKFMFDIDADGEEESISYLQGGSGYLALDKNGDGVINDGSELFGTKSGDGFADLAEYDADGNGWIDENDPIFDKLLIWAKDENGKDELYTLKEVGVGAICLQRAATDFSLNSQKDNTQNGQIRSTGIFLYENGNAGTMQQLDLAQ